jgi:hypothetical protein
MALVYVNPCSMAWEKKGKKGEEDQRKQETKKKGKKISDFSPFFLGLFWYILVV